MTLLVRKVSRWTAWCTPGEGIRTERLNVTYERTLTVPPEATARAPLWLHSTSPPPPLAFHFRIAPFQLRQSHTFTRPSCPAVAMYLPPVLGSTLTLATGPRCAKRRTAGWGRLGVQRVTVPLAWPRCITALCAFWVMALGAPSFVRCSTSNCPVEVS